MSLKDTKAACGYQDKPFQKTCSNCAAFTSERVLSSWMIKRNASGQGVYLANDNEPYTAEKHGTEKNMRCTAHGFAVKKTALCNDWRETPSAAK